MTRQRSIYFVIVFVLALMVTGVLDVLANEVVLDTFSFESNLAFYEVPAVPSFPALVSVASGTGVSEALGGQRDLCLEVTSGQQHALARLRADADNSYLSLSLDSSIKAVGTVQWDGSSDTDCTLDATGLQSGSPLSGVDLTDGGSNAGLLLRIIDSDGRRVDITVKIYTDASNWAQSTVSFQSVIDTGSSVDLFLPFSSFVDQAGDMDETSVGAVELELDSATNSTGADVTIEFIKATGGYEYGDLPSSYGSSILDARHIPMGMRLGDSIDTEAMPHPSDLADGDDADQQSDEDGVTRTLVRVESAPGEWEYHEWNPTDGGQLEVAFWGCGSTTSTRCYINGWIDWNGDGDFGDADEDVINNQSRSTTGTEAFQFAVPAGTSFADALYYARFRICRGSTGCNVPDDSKTDVNDGEIEDYAWNWDAAPTAVALASFSAMPTSTTIDFDWETATEVDNLGFNLARSESPGGPWTNLNASLIPSQVAPGSPIGALYTFKDVTAQPGVTYYYRLEALDLQGRSDFYGPVKASLQAVRRMLVRPRLEVAEMSKR